MPEHYDRGGDTWKYPPREPAPKGQTINLLTEGNKSVTGTWTDDGRFKGWYPLLKRDKEYELQLQEQAEANSG